MKESGNDHWANWIQKDIYLWTTQKRVDNHLRAYGGMGSINDLYVGGSDTIGVWKDKLFDTTKNRTWSLAKGKILKPPLDDKFYRYGSTEISGWRCRHCRHSRIHKSNIELYLSTGFLPKLLNANITLTIEKEWLLTCPECKNKNVCVYRWQTIDNDTKLIESKDNLKMETK